MAGGVVLFDTAVPQTFARDHTIWTIPKLKPFAPAAPQNSDALKW